jgi:dTDP-4-dehydrorhamnose reductase
MALASQRESLRVVDDQFGSPTGAELLADVTAHVIRAVCADESLGGTYHAVAAGETNWCQYARFVIAWARDRGLPIKVCPEAVQGIPTSAYPTVACRPLNSRLDTRKLHSAFGLELPPWQVGVTRMLHEVFRP